MNHQCTLAPEVPKKPGVSPKWPRPDLKSEHQSNLPSAASAVYVCTLRVLVFTSCVICALLHSTLLLQAGVQALQPTNYQVQSCCVNAKVSNLGHVPNPAYSCLWLCCVAGSACAWGLEGV